MIDSAFEEGRTVFLTGATGFVGKVVLEELLRERSEIGVRRIYLLIRASSTEQAEQRYAEEVADSPCFAGHPADLYRMVVPVAGDMEQPGCALDSLVAERIRNEVTHVIHCAASVDFDLPVDEALRINVGGALHVLELARGCPELRSMVSVSTAYVTPHSGEGVPVPEALSPLELSRHPADPEDLYQTIQSGGVDQADLLADSGHPNTYTFTKCLAEHLLTSRAGDVPLTLVRPSIVSASRRFPQPGWIDSSAALAAFVLMLGAGYLRVVAARPAAHIDVVPCDEVSHRILAAAFAIPPEPLGPTRILHAVAGPDKACHVGASAGHIVDFYERHPVSGGPRMAYIGPAREYGGVRFQAEHAVRHVAMGKLAITFLRLTGQSLVERRARQLLDRQVTINKVFPYFTHNTFSFQTSMPLDQRFDPVDYMELVCTGVFENLMGQDFRSIPIAGRSHTRRGSDLAWALRSNRDAGLVIRLCAWALTKIFDRAAGRVTFDAPSFEAARLALPEGSLPVVLPSHRSYMDFLLVPFLFFSRPDIGLSMPHIAADEQFARIPVLGRIARAAQAFFLQRGHGRKDPELARAVRNLVDEKQSVLFFLEGARSRSRRSLQPKRGLLRSLQDTGSPLVALPVAIDFDRVPEEATFDGELGGAPDRGIELRSLSRWLWRLLRGKIDIGSVHITCGEPLPFDERTDPHQLSQEIVRSIRRASSVSTYHLRCFLKSVPDSEVDLDFLGEAIRARGGYVVDSRLRPHGDVPQRTQLSLREQWMHHFHPEARVLFGEDPAIRHHLDRHAPLLPQDSRPALEPNDPRLKVLLDALFEPVATQYRVVGTMLFDMGDEPGVEEIMRRKAGLYRPYVEDAVAYYTHKNDARFDG
jgi:fatty acyl-CoA reductase